MTCFIVKYMIQCHVSIPVIFIMFLLQINVSKLLVYTNVVNKIRLLLYRLLMFSLIPFNN